MPDVRVAIAGGRLMTDRARLRPDQRLFMDKIDELVAAVEARDKVIARLEETVALLTGELECLQEAIHLAAGGRALPPTDKMEIDS
jgi:uncharacterized coiled-coil protein SlyX